MTLRIVPDVREDGTTIRLIGRMRAEHIVPVREEIAASRAPTALDLDEVTLTDIDAVRFLVAAERDGIVLQHCALAREVDASTSEQSGVRQSLAGIAVGEKNRCIRIGVPDATGTPFSGES